MISRKIKIEYLMDHGDWKKGDMRYISLELANMLIESGIARAVGMRPRNKMFNRHQRRERRWYYIG